MSSDNNHSGNQGSLSENEESLYSDLLRHLPAYVCSVKGEDLRIQHANSRFEELVGRELEEFSGKPFTSAFPEMEGQRAHVLLKKAIKTGKTVEENEVPVFFNRKSETGSKNLYFNLTFVPVQGENGNVKELFTMGVEVTEQVRTRKQSEKVKERFKYALKASEDVLYDHDMVGETIHLSDNFQEIFGYTFEGKPFTLEKWASLLHPNDKERINNRLDKVLGDKKENRWEAEFRYKRKDGTYADVRENAYIIRDSSGKPVRMVGVVKDISDRKQRELKKELSAKISRIFNESETVVGALKGTLHELKVLGSFQLAELWLTDRDREIIDLVDYIDKDAAELYDVDHAKDSFNKGEGLPGKTWTSKKTEYWKNLDKRKTFIRREGAAKAGLKTGYGFPIMYDDEVVGVLLLGTDKVLNKEQPFTKILAELAVQLGEEIHRKKLEEELSRIYASAPDGIIVAGFDGYFKKVNPAMSDILGYTEKELLTTPFIEFLHPDDREQTLQFYEEVNAGGEASHFENRYITKSGKVVWLSWSFRVYRQEKVAYSVAKDITAQKVLEELMSQANKLAKIGSWEVDLVTGENYWSEITREIHEVDQDFVPNIETAINFYKEGESREKITEAVNHAIETGEGWDLELQLVTAKGNEKWVRAIGEADLVDGECVRIYGSFQDIHDMKLAQTRLDNTANNLPGVLFQYWLTPDGKDSLQYLSDGSHEIWGITAEEVMEDLDLVWARIYKEDVEAMRKSIIESAETLNQWYHVWRYNHPDGSVQWQEGFGTPQKLDDGTVFWDSIILDVTEKKELEELLAQSNRMAMVGSWNIDMQTGQIFWSDTTREIFEVESTEELTPENLFDIVADDRQRNKLQIAVEKAIETGESYDLEVKIKTEKGNEKWIRTIGKPEFIEGECVRVFGSVQDIHEKKELELLLDQTTKLARVGSWEVNLQRDDDVMFWSDLTREILEVDDNETATLDKMLDFYKPESRKRAREVVQKSIENNEPFDLELLLTTKKGNDRWIRSIGQPESENGKVVRIYGSYQDIHDRKAAEEKLKVQSRHLEAISSLKSALLNYENWFNALNDNLQIIGEAVGSDRVYYFENRFDPETGEGYSTQKLEWCREGITPYQSSPGVTDVPFSEVPEFIGPMLNGNPSSKQLSDVEKGTTTRQIMEDQEIKAFLVIPIYVDNRFHGFVGFDNCTTERYWSEEEHDTLKTITGSLTTAISRQKQDEKLQELLEEKNTILESISDAFYALDDEWNFTYFNSEAERLLEESAEEVIGQNIWDEFEAAAKTELYDIYHEVALNKEARSFEFFYPPQNAWYEVAAYPAENGISVYFKNIDDKKREQKLIKQKTNQLDAIATFNSLLIKNDNWLVALDSSLGNFGEVTGVDRVYFFEHHRDEESGAMVNSMKVEWTGEGVEPELDNPVHQNQDPEDVSEITNTLFEGQTYNKLVENIEDEEFREFLQDQDIKSILAFPVFVHGQFRGFIGFDDCTTGRKWDEEEVRFMETIAINLASAIENEDADEALEEAFQEKNEILESIGDAFFAVDENWTVTYWNHRAEEFLGMPQEQIVGENLWDLYEDAVDLEFYSQYHKAVKEQVMVHFEEYYPATENWFEVSAYPSASGLSVYFKDITERKREQQLILQKTNQLDAIAQFNGLLIMEDKWFHALQRSFEMFGNIVEAERVYYFENNFNDEGEPITATMKLEWTREGFEPQIDNPDHDDLPLDEEHSPIAVMTQNKPFISIVDEIENEHFRNLLKEQDIESLMILPVFVGDTFHGFIGFDDCTTKREWNEDEIGFLKTICLNLASAIEKENSEKQILYKTTLIEAIAEVNSTLLAYDSWFDALRETLSIIGRAVEADRVYYFENHADPETGDRFSSQRLEWTRDEIEAQMDNPDMQDVPFHVFDDFINVIQNNKPYAKKAKHVDDKSLKEILDDQDILSILIIPVMVNDEFYGFIGFDDCTYGRTWNDEEISFLQTVTINLSNAIEAYKAIREIELSNERFLKVSEVSKDAIWDYDAKKETLIWGDGLKKLFGYDPESFGKLASWEERIHEDVREHVRESFRDTMAGETGSVWESEYRFLKADGEYAYIQDKGSVIRNEEGEVIRIVGAMSDVTEQKETEEKLRSLNESLKKHAHELAVSNEELEQFAFVASHDLQEPLRMITGFLAQLEKKYGSILDEKGKKYIHFATDGAQRMRQIILDLLEFSRVGRVDMEKEKFDLNNLVDEVLTLNKKLIRESNAKVEVESLPTIYAAKSPVRQLFQNLINNALKYHKKGSQPKVLVSYSEDDEFWHFRIKDNGIGIKEEYSEKIFTIFQRLHGKNEYEGNGVGLAICKKIVEEHGGEIGVKSVPSEGSEFYFTIKK